MAGICKVSLIGNLTRKPELRHATGGMAIAEVGIAINEKQKNEDIVTFVDVKFFGRTAEVVCEYLDKGSQVYIDGKLRTDSWTDKDTGAKRSKMYVIGDSMQMLGSKASGERSPAKPDQYQQPVSTPSGGGEGGSMEDVPFAPHLI